MVIEEEYRGCLKMRDIHMGYSQLWPDWKSMRIRCQMVLVGVIVLGVAHWLMIVNLIVDDHPQKDG